MAETIEAGYIALIFILMLNLLDLINTIYSDVSGSSVAWIHKELLLSVTLAIFLLSNFTSALLCMLFHTTDVRLMYDFKIDF